MSKILYVLLLFFFLSNLHAFDYLVEIHAKRKVIKTYKIDKNQEFISFTLEGTFTDNLGNYGVFDNASTVILKNNSVIELLGYGKRIYQNKEELYVRGYRNKQEKDTGVGGSQVVETTKQLEGLIGMKCKYAVKFFEDNAYFLQKCDISEKQKSILTNLAK